MGESESIIYRRIRYLCSKKNMKIGELCNQLKIDKYKINRWRMSPPAALSDVEKIERFFGESILHENENVNLNSK